MKYYDKYGNVHNSYFGAMIAGWRKNKEEAIEHILPKEKAKVVEEVKKDIAEVVEEVIETPKADPISVDLLLLEKEAKEVVDDPVVLNIVKNK